MRHPGQKANLLLSSSPKFLTLFIRSAQFQLRVGLEMKTIQTPRFQILIAEHSGMCFGVRQAIAASESLLARTPATILGELAHNPEVQSRLSKQGAITGTLQDTSAPTPDVIITAHGASNFDRTRWREQGYRVLDTTCPLVHVAHRKLERLVKEGYFPVIIGKEGHVEVRGLVGDFPNATVLLSCEEIGKIPHEKKIGVISQTTQPIDRVRALVDEIRRQRPDAEVVHSDTVCQPTKDRQRALDELCQASELVLAIGGINSNNTAQLALTALQHGCKAYHIEGPDDIREEWLHGVVRIGLTAGTSTLDESLQAVTLKLEKMVGLALV